MKRRVIGLLLIIVIAVCLFKLSGEYIATHQHKILKNELKELKELTNNPEEDDGHGNRQTGGERQDDNGQPPAGDGVLTRYRRLYAKNNDIAGWISIAGTSVDYPVMQCADDGYYLNHDFNKKESRYGCLFVKDIADINDGTNFVIYGHNMRDGTMFGGLDSYADYDYYINHTHISFDTLYEERTYQIISVFRSRVFNENDDVFKYYGFYEAENMGGFDEFYNNVKKLSLYDTGITAIFGDTFLTLSTCSYHVDDGRFVIVAKRVK